MSCTIKAACKVRMRGTFCELGDELGDEVGVAAVQAASKVEVGEAL